MSLSLITILSLTALCTKAGRIEVNISHQQAPTVRSAAAKVSCGHDIRCDWDKLIPRHRSISILIFPLLMKSILIWILLFDYSHKATRQLAIMSSGWLKAKISIFNSNRHLTMLFLCQERANYTLHSVKYYLDRNTTRFQQTLTSLQLFQQ